MLEKIFGKKSTGVVYIVCAGILFLALAGAAVDFAAAYPDASLYALFAQALLTLVSMLSISAPLIIQKRFRYYIPPFIEISLCVYAVLLLFLSRMSVPASVLTSMGSAWVLTLRSDQMVERVLLISGTVSSLMEPMG